MVEFNHLLFLLYLSIFHSSVLQVVKASAVLPAYRITNTADRHGWIQSCLISCYIRVFFIVQCYKLCRIVQFSLHIGSLLTPWKVTNITERDGLIQPTLITVISEYFLSFCATSCVGYSSSHCIKNGKYYWHGWIQSSLIPVYQNNFHNSVL